ncbi:helix-turn-helix domain-containing protein [Parasalinivibrio latis]|uniref:XRE family transcriptional regulator n=1 Tax=Parasalinivibrio latis TaxID=2952610 RepID=UPI0030E1861C
MNTLARKIKERMFALGINQRELSEQVGISQVAIHKLVSGKTKQTSKIAELAVALQCEPDWLTDGEEDGEVPWQSVTEGGTPLSPEDIELPYYTLDTSLSTNSHMPRHRFAKSTLRGLGVEYGNAACVTVSGNSMEPVLPDKSSVGIDMAERERVVDGAIYAINHAGLLRVKVLQNLPAGGLRLKSFNYDDYPNEDYNAEQVKDIEILGRAFWYSVMLAK